MYNFNRRDFLKTSGLLVAGSIYSPLLSLQTGKRLLAFSTLGCPDWNFEKIIDFAQSNGYSGIELRGLLRELDIPKCPEFNTNTAIAKTKKEMKDRGLHFVGLGSSATLHFSQGPERQKQLDDGRRFIDLAEKIDCPYVRVFPNNFPKNQDKAFTMDLIVKGLQELGDHAKNSGVMVLMETHGDVVWVDDIEKIMKQAAHKQVGLVWDISNMWTITKEPVSKAWRQLKPYIRHTHIKDAVRVEGKLSYRLTGRGEVPIFEAIDLLDRSGYDGYYSFEWEKMWHPGIEEPEIALADFPVAMKKHFANQGR